MNIVDKSKDVGIDEEKAVLIDSGSQLLKVVEPSVKDQLYRC